MSAQIATYFKYLSNSSLALYFSVTDPTGDKLTAAATEASRLVGWSTVVVAIGVAFELFEPIHDGIAWIKRIRGRRRARAQLAELSEFTPVNAKARSKRRHAASDHPTWVKVFGRIGIVLVVSGVFGEWTFGGQLEDAHNAIHEHDLAKLTAADEKAGDAAASAQRARDAAKQAWEYAVWRTISDKQASMIRQRIQPLKGHKIIFFGNFNDAETQQFAKRLAAVLDDHIMDVSGGVWSNSIDTPPGTKLEYGKERKADFELIVKALDEAGVAKAEELRRLSKPIPGNAKDWLTVTIGPLH